MIKFLFFLLLTTFSWSQENKEILTKDSDTVYWGKYMNRQLKKFDIKSINANEGNLFRLSTYGSIIEIQNNEGNVSGSLTYFVEEVDDSRDEKRTFKKAFSLDNQTVQKLFLLLDSSLVKEIPSDKYIKNWEHGFDGITYFFEIKNDNKYSFKNYWTPKSQDISEALKIQSFVDQFYKVIGIEKYSEEFRKQVPFNSYSYNGGSAVIGRPMTQKEYKEYKKRNRKKKRLEN